nr:hypothetical protein [Tanacetum cinerariifolium]
MLCSLLMEAPPNEGVKESEWIWCYKRERNCEATIFPNKPDPFQKGSTLNIERIRCRRWCGGSVVFGVARSSLGEKPGGAIEVVGGKSRGVEGILIIKIWLENGDGEAMEKKAIYRESHA